MEDGSIALGVVKNGKVEKPEYQVDGISGGTITSVGVDAIPAGQELSCLCPAVSHSGKSCHHQYGRR